MLSLPHYEEIYSVLSNTVSKLHPSQVHGLICGLLCGKGDIQATWVQLVTGEAIQQAPGVLLNLYQSSAKQLQDYLFEFQLLLPADEQSLPVRAEALTLWCQGFLTGLKISFVPMDMNSCKKTEVSEAISDLIEIAKMKYEEVIASEEDEYAYVELVEYVRMAVILIFEDTEEIKAASQSTH